MNKLVPGTISENVRRLLSELPRGVRLEAAAKTRQPGEVLEAVGAGVTIIGESYVQEAEQMYQSIGNKTHWHLIGHLQKNKVKKAAAIFDMIETIDSAETARELDKCCARLNRIMAILIEVNSGQEKQKNGVSPEGVEDLARTIISLKNLKLSGLMTIGPAYHDPESLRPYFAETRLIFETLKSLPGSDMKYLSMGMTDSYRIAIEEGANIVRIGTGIFGERLDRSNVKSQS